MTKGDSTPFSVRPSYSSEHLAGLISGCDIFKEALVKGHAMTDGLYSVVLDEEICEIASHLALEEACAKRFARAEKRGTDDNISVQTIRINEFEQRHFYRGAPYYVQAAAPSVTNEIQPGHVLHDRFEIGAECDPGFRLTDKSSSRSD